MKIDKGKKSEKKKAKKAKNYEHVRLMNHKQASDRFAAWDALAPYERALQMKTEWDFWLKQLRAQNARNDMSYRRQCHTGIIGQKYVLRDKMKYLISFLKELESS